MSSVSLKNNFHIGLHLKELRNARNFTVEEAAHKVGIPLSTYSKYEAGLFQPSVDKLILLAKYFGVSCDFLVLWDETPYPNNVHFLSLAQKVDKLGGDRLVQIKGSLNALMGSGKQKQSAALKLDDVQISLTDDFAKNIILLTENKGIMKKDIAAYLGVTSSQIAHYVSGKVTPSYKNLLKLSEYFALSIHALLTGEKLTCDFQDKGFEQAVLAADHALTPDEHKMLIHLMEAVLKK